MVAPGSLLTVCREVWRVLVILGQIRITQVNWAKRNQITFKQANFPCTSAERNHETSLEANHGRRRKDYGGGALFA